VKKTDLAKYLEINRSTIYRQMAGGGISYRTAVMYEKKLGLKWHEIMAMAASGTLRELLDSVEPR